MQLRMIARRAREGALTILGDVAQGTGAVTYEAGTRSCRTCATGTARCRGAAARLPRAARDHGARAAAPRHDRAGIERPLAYRRRRAEPLLRQVPEDALLREAYHEAARLAREDGLVALIVPTSSSSRRSAHESASTASRC
jgi:hypothetical protein